MKNYQLWNCMSSLHRWGSLQISFVESCRPPATSTCSSSPSTHQPEACQHLPEAFQPCTQPGMASSQICHSRHQYRRRGGWAQHALWWRWSGWNWQPIIPYGTFTILLHINSPLSLCLCRLTHLYVPQYWNKTPLID